MANKDNDALWAVKNALAKSEDPADTAERIIEHLDDFPVDDNLSGLVKVASDLMDTVWENVSGSCASGLREACNKLYIEALEEYGLDSSVEATSEASEELVRTVWKEYSVSVCTQLVDDALKAHLASQTQKSSPKREVLFQKPVNKRWSVN